MRSVIYSILMLLVPQLLHAQCGTDDFNALLEQQYPGAEARHDSILELRRIGYVERDVKTKKEQWVIPVVFHVIHSYGEENISDEQIFEQLRILNEDYSRTNPDTGSTRALFKGIAANMNIEFRLARIAPDGSCTQGITRTYSPLTDGGDQVDAFGQDTTLKGLVKPRWSHRRYLNIWVVKRIARNWTPTNYVAGYAVFPWYASSVSDGIVIRHDFVGASGTSTPGRAGRTLVHEVGHWLGLKHPFQGGCTSIRSYTDEVDDTPPVAQPSYGCPLSNNSCHNDVGSDVLDQVENFMDYSNGSCQNMFTTGQRTRAKNYLDDASNQGRFTVTDKVEDVGVYFTGDCAPIADFHAEGARQVCAGAAQLQFSDHSYNGPLDSWTWFFEGGDPSTSNQKDPVVQYPVAGNFDVRLVVTNAQGSDTMIRTNYVRVFPGSAVRKAPFGERFEPTFYPNDWVLESDLFSGWERIGDRGFRSTASMRCTYSDRTLTDALYGMTLPPIDLSDHGSPVNLSMRHAYAASANGIQDLLYVWVSTNCGETWNLAKAWSATNGLLSVSGIRPNWSPSSDADWGSLEVPLDAYAGSSNVWVRLQMRFRGGNSLFIDDINVAQFGLGIPGQSSLKPFSIRPNPASEIVMLECAQDAVGGMLLLRDLSGRLLLQAQVQERTLQLDCSSLQAGVYFVRVENQGVSRTQQLIISR